MRIQVDCRTRKAGGLEPRSFVLGERRLWVLRVRERAKQDHTVRHVVQTTDGRQFVLEQDLASGEWRFAGVIPRATRRS